MNSLRFRGLALLWTSLLVLACAPLPDTEPEPQPDREPKSEFGKPLPDFVEPERSAPPPAEAVRPKAVAKPVVVPAQPMQSAALPAFEDSVVPAAESLPALADSTNPSITGQFRREEIPDQYRRNIRVGISMDKRTHKVFCGDYCRAVLNQDGSDAGRVEGSLAVSIQSGHVVLESDQRRYRSDGNSLTLEPWDPSRILSLNGKSYRGRLEITATNGILRVVNIVNVEDYLRGVVPNEIGRLDSTMFEALKAQAVAARTYAYKHFKSRSSQGFDVYADVRDQVYDGADGEGSLANQAIDGSMGVVMQYEGSLVEAYYHSTCGGHTESVEAWNRKPVSYLKPVPDVDPQGNAWCALSSYSSWEYRYSWEQLTRIAQKYLATANPDTIFPFNRIEKVMLVDRNPGFRVASVLFVTDRGTFVVKGDKNRWLFRNPENPEKTLPSAWFELNSDADGLTLRGRGFGHGIGLCQMGARALAKAGFGYKDILWHYYPSVDLVKW